MPEAATQSAHVELCERISNRALEVSAQASCLTVGLCGPQGSGKSTLTAMLKRLLEARGLRVATLSLDDFYLPRDKRMELARTVHPLLETRGVPGTHDIPLALDSMAALRAKGAVSLPVFDKAIDDRLPASEWSRVQAPVEVIILEGWCVGAVPQSEAALERPINSLERDEDSDGTWRHFVNRALSENYQALFRQIQLLVLLAPPGFEVVYAWRLQQENDLRRRVSAGGGDTSRLMTDTQLQRFISHYERLTRHILAEMPSRADMVVRLDAERRATIEGD